MSSRPRESQSNDQTRPASTVSSPPRSPRREAAIQRPNPGLRSVTSPLIRPPAVGYGSNPLDLPPLPRASAPNEDPFAPPGTRQTSVSSILNPSLGDAGSSRRRKASELESPQLSPTQQLPPILGRRPAHQSTPMLAARSPAPRLPEYQDHPGRRILTPRSPSLHRAASLGQLNPPTGTMSVQRSPFPPSPRHRTYTVEPGTAGAPPLPPMTTVRQTMAPETQDDLRQPYQQMSAEPGRSRNLSSSASPSTSYSSYSQASHASPRLQYTSSNAPSAYVSSSEAGVGSSGAYHATPGPEFQRPMGIPISSSGGQSVYQMMTLETTSGTVQVPVDVQAASRVADEKRRRNAGASARFRQRRKEKEKEASSTISKLEQQVKEVGEDAEFYRRERDYLANALSRMQGGERHFPRPPSPRHRRSSTVSLPGPSGIGSAAFPAVHEQLARSPDPGRNVRRRTSTMSLPQPPHPQHVPPAPGTPMQPVYGQQHFSTPLVPQHPGSHRVPPGSNPSGMPPGPLPAPSDPTVRPSQQLPALPQVLHQMPQWSSYQSGQPHDPNQRPRQP